MVPKIFTWPGLIIAFNCSKNLIKLMNGYAPVWINPKTTKIN